MADTLIQRIAQLKKWTAHFYEPESGAFDHAGVAFDADQILALCRSWQAEPGWRPIASAPKDVECLFWVVAKTPEESWCDTSGKSIFTGAPPRLEMCKYGGWSSLSKATHWQPKPDPPVAGSEE